MASLKTWSSGIQQQVWGFSQTADEALLGPSSCFEMLFNPVSRDLILENGDRTFVGIGSCSNGPASCCESCSWATSA